ncbi:protein transport protein Sec61 subunit beta-like [Phragmites australis]|uniref:protein transport protein Sec61 subunit beta-like n=1 Tax=Phragmites australis TaxID=29695 RepID=UPI002D7A1BAE|nr:protein transport protein Sec61 subunit beta-like [Phragmites australis]
MARSSSQSQSSVGGAAGSRPATVGPRGTPAAAAGMRRRRATATGGGGGGGFSGGSNMLRFYTDEAPGLRLSPTMVLVMSVCFIGFVTALHVFGKLYRSRTAAAYA